MICALSLCMRREPPCFVKLVFAFENVLSNSKGCQQWLKTLFCILIFLTLEFPWGTFSLFWNYFWKRRIKNGLLLHFHFFMSLLDTNYDKIFWLVWWCVRRRTCFVLVRWERQEDNGYLLLPTSTHDWHH